MRIKVLWEKNVLFNTVATGTHKSAQKRVKCPSNCSSSKLRLSPGPKLCNTKKPPNRSLMLVILHSPSVSCKADPFSKCLSVHQSEGRQAELRAVRAYDFRWGLWIWRVAKYKSRNTHGLWYFSAAFWVDDRPAKLRLAESTFKDYK